MFEPFNCEYCYHGSYNIELNEWNCDYDIQDESECELEYKDDERM